MPPDAETVMEPLFPPKQDTFAIVLIAIETGFGSVIVAVIELIQPLLSVTFAVYIPAVSAEAVVLFPPKGIQLVEYGAVQELILIAATPLLPPKQESFIVDVNERIGPEILTKDVVNVLEQPKESNVTNEYVPGNKPPIEEVVSVPGLQE